MKYENVKEIIDALIANDALVEELIACDNQADKFTEVFSKHGLDISREEALAAFKAISSVKESAQELSDNDLGEVAGGGFGGIVNRLGQYYWREIKDTPNRISAPVTRLINGLKHLK